MIVGALLLSLAQQVPVPFGKGAREPQISVGADGHVALAWGSKGDIHWCAGDPKDRMRFAHVRSVSRNLRYSVGMRRGPRIALLDKDQVVLTVIGGEKGGGNDGDVWAWPADVRVNSADGSAREGLQALARGPKGEVYCTWIDLRSGKPQVYGALSSDAGKTWTNEALVSGAAEICPCCAPSVCFDAQGGVCVMWRGVREGARDMQLARSNDAGKTYAAATKLGSGTWKIDACPMDGGALADLDGKLMTVWRREKDVYLASDATSETLLGAGEQPWIAGGTVVWLEKRGGKIFSLAPGAKEPETLGTFANEPMIAASPDGKSFVYAVWEMGEGEDTHIQLVRLGSR